MTSPQRNSLLRFPGLDTLRAAAILAVMLYHLNLQGLLPSVLQPLAIVGWAGVDLFFVLSGFLIGSQLLKPYLVGQRPSLRDFYTRRAYRIFPAFFVVLLLYSVVPLWREAPGPYAVWQYATFLWNLLLLQYPHGRAFSHVWSLCVEEHFYLFLPLLLLIFMRKPSVWKASILLPLIVLGGIGLRAWLLYRVVLAAGDQAGIVMMRYIYYPTYSHVDGLVVGAALAIVRTFRPRWWALLTRHGNMLSLLGLAFVAVALRLCAFDYPSPDLPASILFAFPALALGFGLLVAAALSEEAILSKKVPGAATVAILAYSLYLTHKSVAHATHQLLPQLTAHATWSSLAIYLLACTGVASLLYIGVERPFLRLRARHVARCAAPQIDQEVRLNPAM
jgi:peptidoglycan/LPS O-acetylase OafA/YrhL